MKRILIFFFAFASIVSYGQTVKSDAALSAESTNEIKNKALNQTRIDAFNQNAIVSKVSTIQGFVTVSGTTYTITDADRDKWIVLTNASGCTVTMDDAITIGYRFNFRRTSAAGTTTFISDGTSILDFPGSANTTSDQTTLEEDRATGGFLKRTSTTFDGYGQLGPTSSGGITNGAANNEIPVSDGTNIVGSGIYSTSSGVVTTGSWNGSDIGLSYIAQGTALSVLGVAGNALADNASIAAGSDAHVLRRSGTNLGFGTIGDASITALALSKITGLGTGVGAALAVNVESAGAPVLFNGAGGIPISIVLTNATGTASGLTAGNVTTNANSTGDVTSVGNATSIATGVIVDADVNASAAIAGTKLANTPAGNIAATTVQAAINELDTEKARKDAIPVTVSGTTYTPTDADADKIIHLTNVSGCTVTLDDALTAGYRFNFKRDTGAGTTTFVSDGTSVLNSPGSAVTIQIVDGVAEWIKKDATVFDGLGNLGAAAGSVSSVDVTVPAFLSVSGNPITTSGTLAVTLSGTALPAANGGTGKTSLGAGVATWIETPSYTNFLAAITGTSPYYLLASGGTLTGVNTFTSNAMSQLISTGTVTSTATNTSFQKWQPTITADANNRILNMVEIGNGSTSMSAGAFSNTDLRWLYVNGGQVLIKSGGTSSSNNALIVIDGSSNNLMRVLSDGGTRWGSDSGAPITGTANATAALDKAGRAFYIAGNAPQGGLIINSSLAAASGSSTGYGIKNLSTINTTGTFSSGLAYLYYGKFTRTSTTGMSAFYGLVIDETDTRNGVNVTTPTAQWQMGAGSTAASTAPLKFTSGSLMTSPEAGAIEFLTDKVYATITTGTTRKEFTLNDAPLTSGTVPVATTNGRLTDGLILASSTYTPTPVNTTNVTASTAYVTGYYRIGSSVTVYGKVDIDATLAASSATELQIDLPIASNMTGEEDLAGTAISDAVASLTARIKADATTDKASIVFKAISLTNDSYSFEFSYQIK